MNKGSFQECSKCGHDVNGHYGSNEASQKLRCHAWANNFKGQCNCELIDLTVHSNASGDKS